MIMMLFKTNQWITVPRKRYAAMPFKVMNTFQCKLTNSGQNISGQKIQANTIQGDKNFKVNEVIQATTIKYKIIQGDEYNSM
jgi:hypothetical protein